MTREEALLLQKGPATLRWLKILLLLKVYSSNNGMPFNSWLGMIQDVCDLAYKILCKRN